MATENKIIKSRIDTAANWSTNNPLIQPGEICFIEGSTDYRVNVSSSATNFSNCQLFKGSDTAGTAPGNGTITLRDYLNEWSNNFTVNQSSNSTLTLPNFVKNAKVEYPTSDVKTLVNSDWTPGRTLRKQLPNCIPTDLVICIIREWAALLQANGTGNALVDAQSAIVTALGLSNLNS